MPITRRRLLAAAPLPLLPAAAAAQGTADAAPHLLVTRSPGCGCCTVWAKHIERGGFRVTLRDAPDLEPVRRAAGVPEDLAGCHTGMLDGRLVVEGHVPLAALRRFLADPGDWRGVAVPGMPLGSPGMEAPGGAGETYTVFAFAADGRRAPLMTVRGETPV